VQRDLLPIVEATTVNNRYGMVKTYYILFMVAGAFHVIKPSAMIPVMEGRLTIRVELKSLTFNDFKRILIQDRYSLFKQYQALLKTKGIELEFIENAISKTKKRAVKINRNTENIGARRLYTLIEKL
jgi:ATP-dependent HslUV protease ATP-binding subunit HslU